MGLRQRGVGANRMGVVKDGREDGRGERNRDRLIERYAKTSLKPVKQREMGVSSTGMKTVSLLLTYTGDPELPRVS